MSDRWVFVAAFLTVVLIIASAFVIPPLFTLEFLKCSIFVGISILVFFGEDRFSYMLGIVAPLLLIVLETLLGGFFRNFSTLFSWISGRTIPPTDTPLFALTTLSEIALIVFSVRVWRRQVNEKFFGKTFVICLVISLIYIGAMAAWYFLHFPPTGAAR